MKREQFVACPGCGALLHSFDGPTHRYIDASPACWAIYTALSSGGDPPVSPTPTAALLVDAYAAQHPGLPSPQSIQSVAVHLMALHGALVRGLGPEGAMVVRQRTLRGGGGSLRGQLFWLSPPSFADGLTVAEIAAGPDPAARAELLERYVVEVWERWARAYGATIRKWYDRFL